MNKEDLNILERIENGNLNEAEKLIEHLENKLINEKLKYNQRTLRDRIKKLKDIYSSKTNNSGNITDSIITHEKLKNAIILNNNASYCEKTKSLMIDKNNLIVPDHEVEKATVIGLENYSVPLIKSRGSVFIIDCNNVSISCYAQQVRIFNSKSLQLKVHTLTGILLENSSDINVYELKDDSKINKGTNKYNVVQDYSNFLDDSNFVIHD